MNLRFADVCAGISAASIAWQPLGWRPAFFAENAAFPAAVLARHWPDVKNHGDLNDWQKWPDDSIDVLVGGTPCQGFSVAGLRKGMGDDRSVLAEQFLRVADRFKPRLVVWENVPGVLSQNDGRDFGAFLGGLAEIGYGWAYRRLDAQYFGLAQQRKRVFVIGYLGDWRPAAAILFERESLSGHPAAGRQARQAAAGRPAAGAGRRGGTIVSHDPSVTLQARDHKGALPEADYTTIVASRVAGALTDGAHYGGGTNGQDAHAGRLVAFNSRQDPDAWLDRAGPLDATLPQAQAVAIGGDGWVVRRLTPRECERLQGFPDDFTAIAWRGKPPGKCPDGPRYRAIGNSIAVPVLRWIGERAELVFDVMETV